MSSVPRPLNTSGFEIGLICALPLEANAVLGMFDEMYKEDGEDYYANAPGDNTSYDKGRIGRHPVVLAHPPGMGKVIASQVSATLLTTFPNIKLGLVVGICGVAPTYHDDDEDQREVLLGDVIISDSMVQLDLGKQYSNQFVRKDTLNASLGRQSTRIGSYLNKMKVHHWRKNLAEKTAQYTKDFVAKGEYAQYRSPGSGADKLYEPGYRHKHHDDTCPTCRNCKTPQDPVCSKALKASCVELRCDDEHVLDRERSASSGSSTGPLIHFGTIASADMVLKSAEHRDDFRRMGVIAFEMEGAGTWDNMPTVVIKGASDYADSHKPQAWRRYAAATAAACMKAFLEGWPPAQPGVSPGAGGVAQASSSSLPSSYQGGGGRGQGNINVTFGNSTARDNGKIFQTGVMNTKDFHM